MAQRVFVTGGAGYVGCVLVPKLLQRGYEVTVYDLLIYGSEGLPSHPRLTVTRGDVRDIHALERAMAGHQTVMHLACISNDPSFDLAPALSKSVNFDCFEPLVAAARASGARRFIYVSTSSVYGVSDAPEVTEEHPLVPLTDYNKYKGLCEPILARYQSEDFTTVTIRPATICGYSPRMRFDLSVNILTNLAVNSGAITVYGGAQQRPHIHIDDICELYVELVDVHANKIAGKIFNASHENRTIAEMAELVRDVVAKEFPNKPAIRIEASPTNDLRSYHVSSAKIARELGYRPRRTIEDAVAGMCRAFKEGKLPNSLADSRYFNVRRMKELALR